MRLILLLGTALLPNAAAAVRGDQTMYVGGTISAIPQRTEGRLDLAEGRAVFQSPAGEIAIPYNRITSIEYGQKVGRRLGVAVAVSPVALLSKKRKHYVTLAFTDESGAKQGAVLELSKGVVRETLSTLSSRSGKEILFESAEARKQFLKASK